MSTIVPMWKVKLYSAYIIIKFINESDFGLFLINILNNNVELI